MVFAYMIGAFLFVMLYLVGIKICLFFNQDPPSLPLDIEYNEFGECIISIDGKYYKCLKTIYNRKTYSYSSDFDVIEQEFKHFKYELQNPITEMLNFIDKNCRTLILNDNGSEIECYMADNLKCFISVNAIENERIYLYRKPEILRKFSLKRKSASL